MNNKRFRKYDKPMKLKRCVCGSDARLIKRRNFPHGRKSKGISYQIYVCNDCNRTNIPTKLQSEVRR